MKLDADGHYEGCPRGGGCTCSVVDGNARSRTAPVNGSQARFNADMRARMDHRTSPYQHEVTAPARVVHIPIAGTPATMLGEALAHIHRAWMLVRAAMENDESGGGFRERERLELSEEGVADLKASLEKRSAAALDGTS